MATEMKRLTDFLLGLGIGHPEATQEYQQPYGKLVGYLDQLDELKVPAERRVLAALGPRVLRLSAERAAGAVISRAAVKMSRSLTASPLNRKGVSLPNAREAYESRNEIGGFSSRAAFSPRRGGR